MTYNIYDDNWITLELTHSEANALLGTIKASYSYYKKILKNNPHNLLGNTSEKQLFQLKINYGKICLALDPKLSHEKIFESLERD